MRIGYAGQASASVAPGVTVGTIADTADMAAADVLLESAAQQYRFDVTAGAGRRLYTARSLAAADDGSRIGAGGIMLFNGASFDPQLNITTQTAFASAARTASAVTSALTNYNARGLQLVLNVTVASGTGGLQVVVRGRDPVSATAYNINAVPTAIIATGISVYELYPGIGAVTGNIVQRTSGTLPRTFDVFVIAGDASSYTYSVAMVLLP